MELSRLAKVSPKTLVRLEDSGIARFDAVARVAQALGQPVEKWLELAGHKVPRTRIEDVLSERRPEASVFPRLTSDEYFGRSEKRLKDFGIALRIVCVMSAVEISTDGVRNRIDRLLNDGMDMAIVCPFPIADPAISMQLTGLNRYYSDAYDWACRSARSFRSVPEASLVEFACLLLISQAVVRDACPSTAANNGNTADHDRI